MRKTAQKNIDIVNITVLVFVIAAVLICSAQPPVFAARSLNGEEKRLIAEISSKELFGRAASAGDIVAFENYLMSTSEPLTAREVDSMLAEIDELVKIIADSGAKSLNDIPQSVINRAISITNSAASVAGLSVGATVNTAAVAAALSGSGSNNPGSTGGNNDSNNNNAGLNDGGGDGSTGSGNLNAGAVSGAGLFSIVITDKATGTPIIIGEQTIKATGFAVGFSQIVYVSVFVLIFISAFAAGMIIYSVRRKKIQGAGLPGLNKL
ncbi:MAG: hypothetical protein FWH10_06260 [Oscillospiraceae bacterium]|nr:hypothetical protein [Oscillospiraceae bacterium]